MLYQSYNYWISLLVKLLAVNFTEFAGTPEYYPPEWFIKKSYDGDQLTVWSVGILLYSVICGHLPFRSPKDITEK